MEAKVFNTVFENMLRTLLLVSVLDKPATSDRIAALDFISIYGRMFGVLDKNLHGDNDFGFAEYADKRAKVVSALRLAVRNDLVSVVKTSEGFLYGLSERGRKVVNEIDAPYAHAYTAGAKLVIRKFANRDDSAILQFISNASLESKEV